MLPNRRAEPYRLLEQEYAYLYEHCFSHHWNALRGYHFLMRLGHLVNILAQNAAPLVRMVCRCGQRGLIQLLGETCSGPALRDGRRTDSAFARLALPDAFAMSLSQAVQGPRA